MKLREGHLSWNDILSLGLSHRRELISAHIIALLAAVLAVPVPLLMPLLVDEVLLEQPGTIVHTINPFFPTDWHHPALYVTTILVLTLSLRLGAMLLGVWQMRQFTEIAKDVTYQIRKTLLLRMNRVYMAEYEALGSGTVASHLVTDIDSIDDFIGVSISKFLVASLTIIGTGAVLLMINWPLGLFILFMNPFVIYLTMLLGRKVKRLKKHENKAYEVFQESLTETLDAIQQIRACNREQHYLSRVIDHARTIKNRSMAFTWKSDAANRLSFLIFLFGFDLFRAISMLMVVFSDLSIGQMLAVFAYLWFMMAPVQEVLNMQYAYHGARAALGRLNRLMDLHEEPIYPHKQNPFTKPTVSIQLDNITFRYGNGPAVLDSLSLHVPEGEKVALVGASGGGKTTLVQVLLGLYTPESGSICFDGIPTTEIGNDVVRENVATVLQHPALFNDSIRSNLTLGKDADDEALWTALAIAQLDDVIRGLPDGLDSIVGRHGVRLSGGQRQRLAIARMILSDPRIIILDEATSALDAETEARLHTALAGFLENKTTLIVAHRLSAVRQASRALVFDNGSIIEDGHHDDLIRNDGLYARLYGKQ